MYALSLELLLFMFTKELEAFWLELPTEKQIK